MTEGERLPTEKIPDSNISNQHPHNSDPALPAKPQHPAEADGHHPNENGAVSVAVVDHHVAVPHPDYQAAAGLVPVTAAVGVAVDTTDTASAAALNNNPHGAHEPLTGATTVSAATTVVPDPATLAVNTSAPEDAAAVIAGVAAVNAVPQVQPMEATHNTAAATQMVTVGMSAPSGAATAAPVSAAYAIHPTGGHLTPQMLGSNLVNMGGNVNMNVGGAVMPKDNGRTHMAMPMNNMNNINMNNMVSNMNVNNVNSMNGAQSVPIPAAASPITKRKSSAPFVCDVVGCGKSFGKKFNLKAHRRVHTGEEPFRCSYPTCGKTFKWKSSLTFHEGLHLNVPDDPQPITNMEQVVVANNGAAPGTTTTTGVPGMVGDDKAKQQEAGKVQ